MNKRSVDVVFDIRSMDTWAYADLLNYMQNLDFPSNPPCQNACKCSEFYLQLAAELGKTLLERNKELENTVKICQNTIDEQSLELEHMKKQAAALKECNDSRLKIYENLEVSVLELERANQRLKVESANDKRIIKNQAANIVNLEARYEDLQKKLDELSARHDALLRHQSSNAVPQHTSSQDGRKNEETASNKLKLDGDTRQQQSVTNAANDKEVTEIYRQLQDTRNQRMRDQRRIAELEEQLTSVLQENNSMEEQLSVWRSKAQDFQIMQEQINTLEEVKQNNICVRCLRGMDDISLILNHEEDDISVDDGSYISETCKEQDSSIQESVERLSVPSESSNLYRNLVDKYEALLEVQRQPSNRRRSSVQGGCISLQEELEMSGEFNSFNNHSSLNHDQNTQQELRKIEDSSKKDLKKPFSGTPTDFSEAETSSSGFLDETSNKYTQTEERSGSFLVSYDVDDCKFSIYDENSSFESRFSKTPEYRQLFSEIFEVLRRAAIAKDDGDKLPLLANDKPQQPEPTPVEEETDDTQSLRSSVISSVMSEPVFRIQTPVEKKQGKQEEVMKCLPKRQLDFFSVHSKKKIASRKNAKKSGESTPTANQKPKTGSSSKKRFRPLTAAELNEGIVQNGATTHLYSAKTREAPRRQANARPTAAHASANFEYKSSSVSEEVAKLKRLEMSYAEALRMPNKSKGKTPPRRR